jgi:hypothetical protein
MKIYLMNAKDLIFILCAVSFTSAQAQKQHFWLLGADVTFPASADAGCNYNVTGIGGALERGEAF